MKYLKTVCTYLLTTASLFALHQEKVKAQVTGSVMGATATGAVTVFNSDTGYTQTVSGQITLPAGEFVGPAVITPTLTNSSDPLIPPVTNLTINPGGIDFNATSTNLNQQISQILSGLSAADDLSEIVSILRANSNLLSSGATSQATATGTTVLIGPNSTGETEPPPINTSIQTVSGEIALPTGLYYDGALAIGGNANDPGCVDGQGCLAIVPIFEAIRDPLGNLISGATDVPRIRRLIIDPGTVELVSPVYDVNYAAATILSSTALSQLSDIVSIIRAASGPSGPFSTQTQARAMGMVMITTPNGSTQSVGGEISLPASLYFDAFDPGNADCASSSCLTVVPDIRWNDASGNQARENSAFIQELSINPGDVQPGDPASATGLLPSFFDFNAAVADILYIYTDRDELDNIVSVIRAGAGANGLTPSNRPTARAFGSATISVPNGSTQSVTAELTLPNSKYFDSSSNFTVTPRFGNIPSDSSDDPDLVTIDQLVIDPGTAVDASVVRGWDFEAAAADALNQADTLEEQVSIIRAAGGAGLD